MAPGLVNHDAECYFILNLFIIYTKIPAIVPMMCLSMTFVDTPDRSVSILVNLQCYYNVLTAVKQRDPH